MIESKREDRLFNDHLAEHFLGERGEDISIWLNKCLSPYTGVENVHMIYTATRTRLINDHLDKWINSNAEKE